MLTQVLFLAFASTRLLKLINVNYLRSALKVTITTKMASQTECVRQI